MTRAPGVCYRGDFAFRVLITIGRHAVVNICRRSGLCICDAGASCGDRCSIGSNTYAALMRMNLQKRAYVVGLALMALGSTGLPDLIGYARCIRERL